MLQHDCHSTRHTSPKASMIPSGQSSRTTFSVQTPSGQKSESLAGLDPVGLLDGVLSGHAAEWSPPPASELESAFPGFTDFEYLDRGAMGAVYAATQVSLQRRVAIKILPPEFGADEAFVTRFQQEALMLARLHHPHIVAVHDFGRSAHGGVYIVMEYVKGTSLLEVMRQRRLEVKEVLDIIHQTSLALQFAHDHGVVHRDIKPTNILIDDRGRVRVADFGLAKSHLRPDGSPTTTQSSLGGTPVYAAPEQMRRNAVVDHRCDIYSTGVTMYELLTGDLPVGNFDPPSKKAATPATLDKIVLKAMREKPEGRHQKASELTEDIERAARRLSTPLLNRAISRRPIVSMMTTIIVTACLILLFGEINDQVLRSSPVMPPRIEHVQGELIHLNDEYCLLNSRLNWEEAASYAVSNKGLQFASLHSAAHVDELLGLLRQKEVSAPIWIGGSVVEPGDKIEWLDATPVDFENWMPASADPPLIITEVQAKNHATMSLPDGSTPDWVEVFNPGKQPVSLHGWHLRHPGAETIVEGRLVAPDNAPDSMIGPGEYRVIICNAVRAGKGPQFYFPLDSQGGRIIWMDPRGRMIQVFDRSWKDFRADISLIADASGMRWSWTEKPSPGAANGDSGTLLRVDCTPSARTASAVIMLPEFGGRWAVDTQSRLALPLYRKIKP